MIGNGSWLLLSCILVFGCNGYPEKIEESTSKPATHIVKIRQMKFQPSDLIVKKGDKVIFQNDDLVAHDITEEKTKTWSSSQLAPGKSWSMTAERTATYYCSLHPVMKGSIKVE
jgi:plastocyanin